MRVCLFAVLAALVSSSASAFAPIDPQSENAAKPGFVVGRAVDVDALPLRSQRTTVEITGVIARVHLEQVWENAGRTPIEANYVFPTSTRAALHDLRIRINDQRELRAEIHAKEEAAKIFDAARNAGKTAGLLEQQRPNAVTMHLTNVMPGDRIVVVIESSELIRPVDGTYELALPQTMGPRYAGNAGSEAFVDNGFIAGKASAVKTHVDVVIRSPIGVRRFGSPSHGVAPRFVSADEVRADFDSNDDDVIADRDLVVRWQLAGAQTDTGVLLFRAPKDAGPDAKSYFLLLGEAPAEVSADEAPARDVVFVVDVSGSMNGFPIEIAQRLVRDLIAELRPQDRFNLLLFAGGNTLLSPTPLAPTEKNRARAVQTLMNERGSGGTEIIGALDTALALPRGSEDGVKRGRAIVVVTDGFVSAERAAFDRVRGALGDATLFAFGVGTSVNRMLIEGLAVAGRTEPFIVISADQGPRAVDQFRTVAARPALTNVTVSFDGFAAKDLEPAVATDLYPGRPLVMLGTFTGPSSGDVIVEGDGVSGQRYKNVIAIEDHLERKEHAVLEQLWARERIARLADRATPSPAELKEVEALGLAHRVLTERTSFVVVDSAARNAGGALASVDQPLVAARDLAQTTSLSGLTGVQGSLGLGGLQGLVGTSFGSGGLGTRGSGSGGGGSYGGVGTGRGSVTQSSPSVRSGQIIYMGSMSREEIQRVISRDTAKLSYCYERQLVRTPGLAGKIVFRWTIGANGHVVNAAVVSDAVGSPEVAACMTRVINAFVFPRPLGGGVVNVTYPFILRH